MARLLIYPSPLKAYHKLHDIIRINGYDLTLDPKDNFDIAINWNFETKFDNDQIIKQIAESHPVINLNVTDVSKSHVEEIFSRVFGYDSFIDPRHLKGACVRKSEKQAAHNGQIIQCPHHPEEGYVYQKLIDNRISVNTLSEIRVPVFKDEIPCIFTKHRSITAPFGRKHTANYHPKESIGDYLHPFEMDLILEFCHQFKLEYGELDIVRNNSDDALYVLDVNNISANYIFSVLPPGFNIPARMKLARTFHEKFIKNL